MRRAREWLHSHGPHTFTSWEELANAFLLHFFPPALTKSFKKQIRFFEQGEEESFYDAYSRFKDLLHECPHHNLEKWELLQSFYDGLIPREKDHLDLSSGGAFMELTVDKGFEMLNKIARNFYLWRSKEKSERRNQSEIPREEELFYVHEDKPFEIMAMTNQSSKDAFCFEDDEDIIPQDESIDDVDTLIEEDNLNGMVEIGCSLDEMYDNELEGFEWHLEELHEGEDFEEDVEDIEKSCEDENVGFIWEFDDLFDYEDSTIHGEILYEDIEEPCDEDIEESSDDMNVGFIWSMDELFEYEDRTLFEDIALEDDLFESWICHRQSEDLVIDHGEGEPLHALQLNKKDVKHARGDFKGRRTQMLMLRDVPSKFYGRKYKWDLKVS